MTGGIFRRPFHQIPRKTPFIPGGPAAPTEQVLVFQNPALLRSIVLRPPRIRRRVTVPPLLGVRQPGAPFSVAKMLNERFRILMMARPRRPFIPSIPVPVVVGETPFPTKLPARLPPAIAARPRVHAVPTFPAAVGPTPLPQRPEAQRLPVVARARPPSVVPTFPTVGPTIFIRKAPLRPPSVTAVRVPRIFLGGPAAPAVPGQIPFRTRRPPYPIKPFLRPQTLLNFPRPAPSSVFVIVCSSGVWSVEVSFDPCDTYRMELRGPAVDNMDAAVAIEFVDPDA